jgi:proton-translocating NADH-quinone oxidoreductase chain L
LSYFSIKIITIFNLFNCLFCCIFLFYDLFLTNNNLIIYLFNWIIIDGYYIYFFLNFDFLTIIMTLMVIIISSIVHLYSFEYMRTDAHIIRFISYLSLFTFFMLILITAPTLLQLFIGWEGVGICSYLLVNFWFLRLSANKSSLKAILVNRIGDCALIIAFLFILALGKHFDFYLLSTTIIFNFLEFQNFNIFNSLNNTFYFYNNNFILFSYNFYWLFEYLYKININYIDFLSIFLFIAAVGKSAQIGLHTWLPDAMEGPTPVSALIHAATMVTAGIFLIIKCSIFIFYSNITSLLIIFFGSFTILLAGVTALLQNDMKKIIAYSTCSQLGYMFLICGFSTTLFSFFHLINHAFFKALLFLGSGLIIHSFNDEQDIRKIGATLFLLPLTFCLFFIGSLAIIGFPFLTGYFSKDFLLFFTFIYSYCFSFFHLNFSIFWIINDIIYIIISLGAILTIIYSCKILYFIFFTKFNGYFSYYKNIHEISLFMFIVLFFLAINSIFLGFYFKEFIYENSLLEVTVFSNISTNILYFEYIPFFIKIIPIIFIFIFFIFFVYYKIDQIVMNILYINMKNLKKYFIFIINKWFFDNIQNKFFLLNYKLFLKNIYFFLDKGYLEYFGPFGITSFFFLIFTYLKYLFIHNMSWFNKFKEFQLFTKLFFIALIIFLFINIFSLYLFYFFY